MSDFTKDVLSTKALESQSTRVFLTIRKLTDKDIKSSIIRIKEYADTYFKKYAYIIHHNHMNDDGELESDHIHLVGVYKDDKVRFSTRLNTICDFFGFDSADGVQIKTLVSWVRAVQYLIHKNNPEKTQDKVENIVFNYDSNDLVNEISAKCDTVITFDFLITTINECNNIIDVIKALGLDEYRRYRNVVWDIWNEINPIKKY